MVFKEAIKTNILKGSEYFLFFVFDNFPEKISLICSRILRKLLFRERLIESRKFQNYGQYRDFLKNVLVTHHQTVKKSQPTNDTKNLDFERVEQESKIKAKKVFIVCCDGNQNGKRTAMFGKTPAIFLDVWRDTAEDAGLKTQVSIANDFMYDPKKKNLIGKNKYVLDLIKSIKTFKPNLLLFDINFKPSQFTVNGDDIDRIKKETGVFCIGNVGDILNQEAISNTKIWAPHLDFIFHGNIELFDGTVEGMFYVPYTCSTSRYHPSKNKRYGIFFSGIANISRLYYILTAKKFAEVFFQNFSINFFTAFNRRRNKFLDQQSYDSTLRQSKAVLDLTHRSRSVQNTSGRMFQAMASKSLLVAEECQQLNSLLRPYIEYLPFNSGNELELCLKVINNESGLCESIVNNARKKFDEEHSPMAVWEKIFEKVQDLDTQRKSKHG